MTRKLSDIHVWQVISAEAVFLLLQLFGLTENNVTAFSGHSYINHGVGGKLII